jgi:hypothetical protein
MASSPIRSRSIFFERRQIAEEPYAKRVSGKIKGETGDKPVSPFGVIKFAGSLYVSKIPYAEIVEKS